MVMKRDSNEEERLVGSKAQREVTVEVVGSTRDFSLSSMPLIHFTLFMSDNYTFFFIKIHTHTKHPIMCF